MPAKNLLAQKVMHTKLHVTHFEKFEYIVSDVEICESWVEDFKVGVMDVFCDEAWNFGRRVSNDRPVMQ